MQTSSPLSVCHRRGFTLIELLTVIAIISIMSALAVAAFASLKKADGFNGASSAISTLLEQARAYAMANNTYVFVGFEETDASFTSTQPQTPGTGRVAVQAFASLDATLNLSASNLAAISRLQILDNLDIPASLASTTGSLTGRPSADYFLGNSSFPTVAPSSAITSRNFSFSKVIAFDSLGIVHIPSSPPVAGFQYLEIDVQPTNGKSVPASAPNVSAIQVDATTGIVNIYRS